MANETPPIQNTKLLILALGLAAIVVILYNVHINQIRNENKTSTVKLLQYTMNKDPGDVLSDKGEDIATVEVSKPMADSLSDVYRDEQRKDLKGKTLAHSVMKGRFVLPDDFIDSGAARPSSKIAPGMVQKTLPLDPRYTPGRTLRVGDRVNVMGIFLSKKTNKWQTYHIIDGVSVLAIGGVPLNEGAAARKGSDEGVASYRTIDVAIPVGLETELPNVITHAQGGVVWVDLINQQERKGEDTINKDLEDYRYTAASADRTSSGTPPPPGG